MLFTLLIVSINLLYCVYLMYCLMNLIIVLVEYIVKLVKLGILNKYQLNELV